MLALAIILTICILIYGGFVIYIWGDLDKGKLINSVILALLVGLNIWVYSISFNNASWQRTLKSVASEYGGGLNRTVTLYDYNGNVLDEWSGQFDVTNSETEVYFDLDGKRVIIHGGIVVNEEQ